MPGSLVNCPSHRLFSLLLMFVVAMTSFAPSLSIATEVEVELAGVKEARQQSIDGEMLLIDIRRPDEWQASGIPDVAIELNMKAPDFLERLITLIEKNPDKRIGLICAVGSRSRYVTDWLHKRGVKNVVDVSAGVHGRNGWLANKLPVRRPG